MADMLQDRPDEHGKPQGIGGWLWLPAIFVCLSPVYIGWRAIRNARTAAAILGDATPLDTALLVFLEFAVTAAMLAASLYLIYLLAKQKRAFLKAFITFLIGGVVMAATGLATTLVVLGSEVETAGYPLDLADLRGLLSSLVWAAIWIPYMQRSQRVKATFVQA